MKLLGVIVFLAWRRWLKPTPLYAGWDDYGWYLPPPTGTTLGVWSRAQIADLFDLPPELIFGPGEVGP